MGWIKDFILSSSFGSILGIILTAVLTFLFTKRTERTKQSTDICVLQLEKIFYPLYLKVHNKKEDEIDGEILFSNLINKKRKYYLYLPDDFIRIIEKMEKEKKNDFISKRTMITCKMYIEYQYFKLRRKLGYSNCDCKNIINKYGLYVFIKCIYCIFLTVWIFLFTVLAIFGGDLFYFSAHIYNSIMWIIGIITIIYMITALFYIYYSICWYLRFKE